MLATLDPLPHVDDARAGARAAAIQRVARALARPAGPNLLDELAAELAAVVPSACTMVSVFTDESHTRLRTVSLRLDGQAMQAIEYPVAGSPCQSVVGRDYSCIASGVRQMIDPASAFHAAGLDSYAAVSLVDSDGHPLGVLAALDRGPIAGGDAEHARLVLELVAGRVAAELERERTLQDFREAARAVSAARGDAAFDQLVAAFARLLRVEFAFIARVLPGDPDHLTMLSLLSDGQHLRDVRYAIAPTPCRTVLGQRFRLYAHDLAALFPEDPDVLHKGAESYAGHPLLALDGRPLGVIAVGSRQPLQRSGDRIASLLEVFAVRAAAEVERLESLEALRLSEASYRTIFDAAEDGIYVHDWDSFALLDVNPTVCAQRGMTRAELLAADPATLAGEPPYDLASALEKLRLARLDRCPPFEWRMSTPGGTNWFEMRLKPALLGGRRRILAFARNITERKAADEQLRASEEQHRTIFNASVDGMLIKDASNIVVDVNDAFLRMHGYTRDQLVGRCLLERLPPPLQARCLELLPGVLEGTPCHFEVQTWRHDGSLFDVEIHGVRVVYGGQTRALVIMRDITERKAGEALLRASEEQYRAIFDASDDALMLWDDRLKRVDVNPAHERIFGYARDEVVGHGFEGIGYPEHMARERLEMVRRALAGEPSSGEFEAQRKDGRRIVTELRTIPFRHRGEAHVLQIARDVTEGKLAEARLRGSEEQYRAIFNATSDAIALWDDELVRVDVNDAYVRLYGWSREEVIGKSFGLVPNSPHFARPREELLRRSLAGETCRAELEAVHKDGHRLFTELVTVPFLHRGRPHVLAIARDITARMQAETRLRAQEERYRAIFDGSIDPMVLWNRRLEVVDVNRAFEEVKGFAREQFIGRHWSERADALDMDALMPFIEMAFGGQPAHTVQRVSHADGHSFDMELRYLPVRLGDEDYVLGIGRDITERLERERELQRSEAQLRQAQKMEAIGQLTGGIAHDFNNILASVLGYLVLAQERAAALGDERLLRQLGQVQVASHRARDLIAQMLAFARRKAGRRQTVSPDDLIREAVDMLRPTLPSSVVLAIDPPPPALPPVDVDAVQMGQVLMNLLINARDAVGGTGHVRVGLATSRGGWRCRSCGLRAEQGSWLELRVSDDGSGIAPQTMQRMFDPFFTTKPAGSGSGMGLAMVHGIVHEHGGHVGVDTRLGQGTLFRVLLPAAGAPAAERKSVEGAVDAVRAVAPPLQGQVLVVEDDLQVGAYLAEQLETWGLGATLITDPREAIAWLRDGANALDLLLTDLTMPHLSGLQLAAQAVRLRPNLPVLLVSADAAAADDDLLRASGIRAALHKPIDAAVLRRTLWTLLDEAASRVH